MAGNQSGMVVFGYVAFYADGSENDSPEFYTASTIAEAIAIAWSDRVVYDENTIDKPVAVLVYDENFITLGMDGTVPSSYK